MVAHELTRHQCSSTASIVNSVPNDVYFVIFRCLCVCLNCYYFLFLVHVMWFVKCNEKLMKKRMGVCVAFKKI